MEQPVDQLNQEQELTQEQLSELLQVRRDKLSALQAAGQDPFANTTYDVSHYSAEILAMPQPAEGERGTQYRTVLEAAGGSFREQRFDAVRFVPLLPGLA